MSIDLGVGAGRIQKIIIKINKLKLHYGGGGEIRTLGGLSPSLVFKTSALNRSATPPADGNHTIISNGSIRGRLRTGSADIILGQIAIGYSLFD